MINFIGQYCKRSSNNNAIELGGIVFYFSYQTLIAVETNERLVMRENVWGPTTGKHLNAISDNKKSRVSVEEFQKFLSTLHISIGALPCAA